MKSINPFSAFIAVLTILCMPAKIVAQSNAPDTLLTYSLDELIVTASRYAEHPFKVGRNVTVIPQRVIENTFHFNPAGLLARFQSIHMVGSGQTPGSLTQGFLRGSNSNHFIVMIDGIRISDPSTVNNAVNLSEISLLGVERIEVVRGSHSTLYGSAAIGGVINIITRKKGEAGFNIDVGTRNGVFGEDTFSTSNNLMANYTSPDGWYVNAGLFQQYANGLDATVDTVSGSAAFNPQDGDDFEKLDISGRVGYKTESAGFYLFYRNHDQTADTDQSEFTDDSNAFVSFSRSLYGYGAFFNAGDNIEFELKGAYSNISRDFVNDSSFVDRFGNFDGTYVENNFKGSLYENNLTATYSGRYLQTIAGIESAIQTMSSRNYFYSRSFGIETVTDLDSLDLQETTVSGFMQVEVNGGAISKSLELFSLVLGGRILHHDRFGTHFTYEINPKMHLAPSTLIYGAVSTGYNAPSLYQLYSPDRSADEEFVVGNPMLEPEQSVSYELGWKQQIGSIVNFEVALFNTQVKNIITYVYLWDENVPVADLTFSDYSGDTYINFARQDIKGVEIGLNVRPFNSIAFGGNLTLMESTLTYSPGDLNTGFTDGNHVQVYNSGTFVNSENELDGLTRRPAASAYIWASYRPIQSLNFKITSKFVGARDDIYYSANLGPFGALDHTSISGYNLTDVSAVYKINQQFSVGLQVENIFDTEYTEIRGYNTRGRGLFLQASYQFGSF